MAFNVADHPKGFGAIILSHFHGSLTRFWRQALSAALGAQATHTEATHTLPKTRDPKWRLEERGIVQTEPEHHNTYCPTKSSWTQCVREALQQLAKHSNPMIQHTLDNPPWNPLSPGMDAESSSYLRKVDNWVKDMVVLFESGYNRLKEGLESEVW
ncbi:unnamed protein product [Rhizoctonia solani]|nr:unnamed protein product [Rhizoctonia solani]